MHAEYYHVIPRIFTEIKSNQHSYFEELDSKGYFLPKPFFMLPSFYRIHFWVLILMTLGTRHLGNQQKAFTVSSALHFTSTQALLLVWNTIKRAFWFDCFRLCNPHWLHKMGGCSEENAKSMSSYGH